MVYTPSAFGLNRALRTQMNTPAAPQHPGQSVTVTFLRSDGTAAEAQHNVPASPVFTWAFSAFARGTLIATTRGPVAIEDLHPGMMILTNERGPSPLIWIGSMRLPPCARATIGSTRLARIMTGALGMGRPIVDLMTGPGARIAQRSGAHAGQVMRPVHDMIDGTHVIALSPPGAVELYHIALPRHATITAAGLTLETYHPGPGFEAGMPQQQLSQFLELFPHIRRPSDFGGLEHPRAPLDGPRLMA